MGGVGNEVMEEVQGRDLNSREGVILSLGHMGSSSEEGGMLSVVRVLGHAGSSSEVEDMLPGVRDFFPCSLKESSEKEEVIKQLRSL